MLFAQQPELVFAIVILVVILLATAIMALLIFRFLFLPWLRSFTSGVPIPTIEILGMRFRKVNVNAVLDALILAKQSGVDIGCRQMERAYLQGCDLETLTLAMIRAKQEGFEVTFEELAAAEVDGRLSEKLESFAGRSSDEGRHPRYAEQP